MSNNIEVVTVPTLVEIVKAMVSPTQIPVENRAKTNQVNPTARVAGANYTSKDKAVIGVDDDRSICWSSPNFVAQDAERFRKFAKACDLTPAELGATIVMDWFDKNYETIDSVVADQMKADMTEEQKNKKLLALEAQIAKLKALQF